MVDVKLYLGDCLEYMRGMEDKSVDAIITDSPYGTKKVIWDESIDPEIFSQCIRISKGYCVFFYSNTRLWHILGILHGLGVDTWVGVWYKNNAMGFERKFAPLWVPIVIAYQKGCKFFGQDLIIQPIIPHKNINHPTIKPIQVISKLIEKTTLKGQTIFDPFMGSGTTGLACIQTGRNFIGCEIHQPYFEIAQERIRRGE